MRYNYNGDKMNEYRKLVKFNYKKKAYQLLLDDNNKYFFLKILPNGSYAYVNIFEYIEFVRIFCRYPQNMFITREKKNNKKMHIIPRILIRGTAVLLTFPIVISLGAKIKYDIKKERYIQNSGYSDKLLDESKIQRHVSFTVEDSEEDLVVDTVLDNEYSDAIYIYDAEYLDDYLGYKNVSREMLLEVLNNNDKIDKKYKDIIREFIDNVCIKYPEADRRAFYENLKTLEVIECSKNELMIESLSMDSCACYSRSKNKIYTLADYEYKKGTWEYQVIFHEISHAFRLAWIKNDNGKTIKIQGDGPTLSLVIVDEALNSLFTVGLFDYQEKDIAYQLQSNYLKVMLECMDNYKIQDYANHSLSYFAKKLDEHNQDNNYATVILSLIDTQYKDYHSDKIEIEQEEYYPIYDYIADMYYMKYITPGMSYSEALKVADTLVNDIMFDVPEDYNIDTSRFYTALDNHCQLVGIPINSNNKTL